MQRLERRVVERKEEKIDHRKEGEEHRAQLSPGPKPLLLFSQLTSRLAQATPYILELRCKLSG
jgi:hypothetical protein